MGQRGEMLAGGVEACKQLLGRYLAGFDNSNATVQPPGLPNHVLWSLEHLSLTMHRGVEKLTGETPEGTEFGTSEGRVDPALVGFASVPVTGAGVYPSLKTCIENYERACDRLAGAVRSVPDGRLDERTPWGNTEITLGSMVQRLIFHNGMHTGQIADLRRALGMKSIFA